MAKVLHLTQSVPEFRHFHELSPKSFYIESDLENFLIKNLEEIFPEFKAIVFKMSLKNNRNGRNNKPDLAMIKRDYTEWYIIEVELGSHSINHVAEQIDSFRNCDYDNTHARYIYDKEPTDFELEKLETMIQARSPKIMVIVNEPKDDWKEQLKEHDCLLCVFQIYRNQDEDYIYRINGEHPLIYTHFCFCKAISGLPSMLELFDTGFCEARAFNNEDIIEITYRGKVLRWTIIKENTKYYLMYKQNPYPLDPLAVRYMLSYNQSDQNYYLSKV